MTTQISITDIEAAINYLRQTHPAQGEELRLHASVASLAEPYAMLIMTHRVQVEFDRLDAQAQEAIKQWQQAFRQP